MFGRNTLLVWMAILVLAGMFLLGQDTWPPPQPKTVFATHGQYTGNLGGLHGADAICQAEADAAGLPGVFKAWLSDSVEGPDTRFARSSAPYELVDGSQIAADWSDLTDGSITREINMDPYGYYLLSQRWVWTNTLSNGTPNNSSRQPYSDCCGDWHSDDFNGWAGVIYPGETPPAWTESSWHEYCWGHLKLYCFQQ